MKIQANGIEMNYEVSGQGKCLVLIHGFSDNLNMWFNQTPEFSKKYMVLTYDVRGHGRTQKTDGPFSMQLFGDDLAALLQALKIKSACVLGYSMGGRIALNFAFNHPDVITGLIFANSGVGAPPDPSMEERRKTMGEIMMKGEIEPIAEMFAVGSFSPGFKDKNPATFKKYKDIKMQNDPSSYIQVMMAMGSWMPTLDDLGKLTCPVAIIAGEQDGFQAVSTARAMHQAMQGSVLSIFPTGHAAALEAPADFNRAVLNFVDSL